MKHRDNFTFTFMMLHGIMLTELCIHWSQVVVPVLLADISLSVISRRGEGERERENDVDVEVRVNAFCWITFLLDIQNYSVVFFDTQVTSSTTTTSTLTTTMMTTAAATKTTTTTVTSYIIYIVPCYLVTRRVISGITINYNRLNLTVITLR
jgi:hypothetical protein